MTGIKIATDSSWYCRIFVAILSEIKKYLDYIPFTKSFKDYIKHGFLGFRTYKVKTEPYY